MKNMAEKYVTKEEQEERFINTSHVRLLVKFSFSRKTST